jgi:hypothetical protein
MRTTLLPCLVPLLSLSLPAQGTEWTTNGSFTATLAPWVMGGGYSLNPMLETVDTTGLGASDSFGASPGGQVTPAPYPQNTLEEQVLMINSLTYEFRCDAMSRSQGPNTNVDGGTVWVEVDNVEVARFVFGQMLPGQVKRTQLCGRFQPVNSGQVTLRINMQRNYLCNPSTPRVNIDNVSVKDVAGPTFWINSNRQLGTTVVCAVRGDANATYATFIAAGELNPGLALPGINGLLMLNSTATMLTLAPLSAMGVGNSNLAIPNLPFLLTTPFWFQAGMLSGSAISLGFDFGVVFVQ